MYMIFLLTIQLAEANKIIAYHSLHQIDKEAFNTGGHTSYTAFQEFYREKAS